MTFPSKSISPLRRGVALLLMAISTGSLLSVARDFSWVLLVQGLVCGTLCASVLGRFHREYVVDDHGILIQGLYGRTRVDFTSVALVKQVIPRRGCRARLDLYTTHGSWIPLYPVNADGLASELRRGMDSQRLG